ncbi:MAG: magnesium transporter [Candidatus Sulfomarinibacteraceae bacterium]
MTDPLIDQPQTDNATDASGDALTVDFAPDGLRDAASRVEGLIAAGDATALDELVSGTHPADLAALLRVLSHDLWPHLLSRLDIARISDVMEELPDHLRDDLAEHLHPEQLTDALGEMASDDAADVIADLPERVARGVIRALPRQDRREVEALLAYPEDSAGGLMQMELVSISEDASVNEVVEAIRSERDEVGEVFFVYVVDADDRLVGVLNLGALLLARGDRAIRDLMKTKIHAVTPEEDQESVARIFKRYDLVALPVVDAEGRLLGRIMHDDVVDVLQEEADEDIMHMAGATAGEPELVYTDQLFRIAGVRLPWLLATLAGLAVPAVLTRGFQVSFPHMDALVPFVLVIGAMGGNVGSQSATIVVRGFATGRVDFRNLGHFLFKELVVSSLMGLACGVLSGLVSQVWHGDLRLSATVGISMFVAIIASAILGVLVPFFFRLVKIDPAIAAGPAVTTIDDIVAIAIYYVVAILLITA